MRSNVQMNVESRSLSLHNSNHNHTYIIRKYIIFRHFPAFYFSGSTIKYHHDHHHRLIINSMRSKYCRVLDGILVHTITTIMCCMHEIVRFVVVVCAWNFINIFSSQLHCDLFPTFDILYKYFVSLRLLHFRRLIFVSPNLFLSSSDQMAPIMLIMLFDNICKRQECLFN